MSDYVEFVKGANATPDDGTRVKTIWIDGRAYQVLMLANNDGSLVTETNAMPVDLSACLTNGTLTELNDTVEMECTGRIGTVVFQVLGTWQGKIVVEGAVDGTYANLSIVQPGNAISFAGINNDNMNGVYRVLIVAGYTKVRLRMSSYTSGTATVIMNGAQLVPTAFVWQLVAENLHASAHLFDESGNAFTRTNSLPAEICDAYGFHVECTPMDELRAISPFRLVGAQFSGATLDTNFWTPSLGTGGAATVGGSQVILSTGTTANNSASIQSVRSARYVGGSSNRFRCVMRLPDTGTVNNVRRWGAYSTTDGAFFELSGTAFRVVTRKTSNDTVVASANFNGSTTVPTLTTANSFEIYWTNSKVYFVANGVLLHTFSASAATWSDAMSLPVRFETINSGGATGDIAINMRTATIHRMGEFTTQPMSKYQAGTTAGIILKYGAGNLHGSIISGVVNNSVVTIRDGLSNAAPIIWSSGAMAALTTPFSLDFHDVPFVTGLWLEITAANSNVFVAYE